MPDITSIFGGPFVPRPEPSREHRDPPEVQLADAMAAHGLPISAPSLDGDVHRFDVNKRGDKLGWYVAYGDGIPAGAFGNWKENSSISWRADIGRTLTLAEEMAHTRRMGEIKAARDAALKKQRDVAADTVEEIWEAAQPADPNHPYLVRKGVQPHGERQTPDGRLICPLYKDDQLRSVQYISADGTKRFHSGGETGSCFDLIGSSGESSVLYIAEGRATAATVHEATGLPCAVAYSAGNIPAVAIQIRAKFPGTIIIVADNDAGGVGKKYAGIAAAETGATVVMPPDEGDVNDYAQAGGDVAALLAPPANDWLVRADDFSAQPAPIRWLIKGWLPKGSLSMIHGPPAAGKSFLALDWVMTMAAGGGVWNGHKTAGGNHVYLAGEGHHGLRARVAAWKQHYGAGGLNLWIAQSGLDLNTPAGFAKAVESLIQIGQPIDSVTVDTVHRFYAGDENSAQDVRTMIQACDALREQFGCAVVLVHHTGVSEDAQHRARGSSAWRGALDIEVSVSPSVDGKPMEVIMRKAKDSEMAPSLAFRFEAVKINGWFDEDGDPVTSVVLKRTEPVAKTEAGNQNAQNLKIIRRHWEKAGELVEGQPYITRSALVDGLESEGFKRSSAEKKCQPTGDRSLIGPLLDAGIIEAFEHGWRVIHPATASAWQIGKLGA